MDRWGYFLGYPDLTAVTILPQIEKGDWWQYAESVRTVQLLDILIYGGRDPRFQNDSVQERRRGNA